MKKKKNINYAFIDHQNLYLGIKSLGWSLDWKKLRVYLREKYNITTAYLFLGYLPENQSFYQSLQKRGFILIFKEVLRYKDGSLKGNVDAELVLQTMIDLKKYHKALIISGDGDFSCLVRHLKTKNKLEKVLVPNIRQYSCLLKKAATNKLIAFNNLRKKLEYKKRTP